MINQGGMLLVVHLATLMYHKVIKVYPRTIGSILVVAIVAVSLFSSAGQALETSINNDNNVERIQGAFSICTNVVQADSANRVILRLDDIQAFAYTKISEMMIENTIQNDMKLVLGVVPKDFLRDGPMNAIIKKYICNLEIAMHGWDHLPHEDGSYEFEDITEENHDEVLSKIKEGREILETVSEGRIWTFIPPGNKVSDYTKKILAEQNIRYISAYEEETLYDMHTTTFDFRKNELVDVSIVIKDCQEKFKKNEVCVIALHPQDYLTNNKIDLEKYATYIDLLNKLKEINVKAITFPEMEL